MDTSSKFSSVLIFVLFIIFFPLTANAQSGWVQQNSGITGNVTFIEATDANNAFVGNPVYKTTNGGATWFSITVPAIAQMQMINAATGYASINFDYLRKTTNAGLNWFTLPYPYPPHSRISFFNENIGILGGEQDMNDLFLFRTYDGGNNWTVSFIEYLHPWPDYLMEFYCVKILDGNVMYISYYVWHQVPPVTANYYLKKSTDGGNNFSTLFNGVIYEMDFPSATTGFARTNYTVYKSVNDNWGTNITLTTTNTIQNMEFPSVNTGYIVCNGGVMYKTTNGGSNWYTLNMGTTRNLLGVKFINELTGWVVGDSGLILKTTTGGETPIIHSVSGTVRYQDNNQPVSSGYVKALSYNSQNQQITVVDSAAIQSNGTYMLQNCPPIPLDIMAYENDEEDASFVPTYYVSTIYWENSTQITPDTNLTGIDIGVYRINNTANNMHIGGGVYSAGNVDLAALKDAIIYAKIGNVFKGYSVTGYPGIYRIDSLSQGIYEVICNRMGYYSAVRPFQLTTFSVDTIDFVLSILLVSVEPNSHNIPEKYWLSQNYPNPFNPQTKIKFGLPEQSYIKLTVYDILGREVGILLDQVLRAGEYNVSWDASRLASGIYFYRLETDRYAETKKMVLMK